MKSILFVPLVLVAAFACGSKGESKGGAATAAPPVEADVRPAAFAGRFYPGDAATLRRAVELYLGDAIRPGGGKPLALVAPHAGYIYSGQIAADAWNQAKGAKYDVVVILGTNHTVPPFDGVALWPKGAFATPLGKVGIDEGIVAALLAGDGGTTADREPHRGEHSIEVQLPFVQTLFPGAKIVAGVVGRPDVALATRFGRTLAKALEGKSALVVASSDLSHYPAYRAAREVDRKTLEAIATLDPAALRRAIDGEMRRGIPELGTAACGEAPILATLVAARALGATHARVVAQANSGDTAAGERDRVVGYGAVALFGGEEASDTRLLTLPATPAEPLVLTAADEKALLAFARRTVEWISSAAVAPLPRSLAPRLEALRGAFVTLKKNGELRGCVGHITPDSPLSWVVGSMALAAGWQDRRFPPLEPEELRAIEIEISVLTPPKRVGGPGDIVVGRDGVILSKGGRSAVFLPQVAPEQGWSREQMLDHLAVKAGLPADAWREGARFETFEARVFREATPLPRK
jgi:AmmeMemoRadiSam system protein B/AmmeMemoRadiSam system protein A